MTENEFCGIQIKIQSMLEQLGQLENYICHYRGKGDKTKDMTFGEALEAIKQGKRVSEIHFKSGVYFELQNPNLNSKMTQPYIYIHDRNGDQIPCLMGNEELLSNKWFIVQ